MTFARSPVIPKTTRTSAGPSGSPVRARAGAGAVVVISPSSSLIRVDADASSALVRDRRARPVDDRLRAVLVCGQQRQMDGRPGELGLRALHGLAAEHLDDGRAAPDRRHRALVDVLERLRLLALDDAVDGLPGVLARLQRGRAELR